jgi:hypothetical protein
MSHSEPTDYLRLLIQDNDWEAIPEKFITREGREARITNGRCYLPIESERGVLILEGHCSPILSWAATKYLIYRARTTSSMEGNNSWRSIFTELAPRDFLSKSASCVHPEIFKEALISQVNHVLLKLRAELKLHRAYRLISFYVWAAEYYPDLGFCPMYAHELGQLSIPGNIKGAAVRSNDEEEGALHSTFEVPLVTNALARDKGTKFEHYQQRAAVALSMTYGRNSANYRALWEQDLVDLADSPSEPWYVLNMPRIKKGFRSARHDFIEEPISGENVRYVIELIEQNKCLPSTVEVNGKPIKCDRSLFRLVEPNSTRLMRGEYSSAYEMYSSQFCRLLQDFAERMNLISPLTGERMRLTTRRFRYTSATMYAAMGATRRELAAFLDHTDTQNVDIYFDAAAKMLPHLDKAAALVYAEYVDVFRGHKPAEPSQVAKLIASDREVRAQDPDLPGSSIATGGCELSELCTLSPPLSCYLCPKFRPYKSPVHSYLLSKLLAVHQRNGENSPGAPHRMDVIYAVSQVVRMCEEQGVVA